MLVNKRYLPLHFYAVNMYDANLC